MKQKYNNIILINIYLGLNRLLRDFFLALEKALGILPEKKG